METKDNSLKYLINIVLAFLILFTIPALYIQYRHHNKTKPKAAVTDSGQDTAKAGVCGNKVCESSETCSSCPEDCGLCANECGNCKCEAGETCTSCSLDCCGCGDGVCYYLCGENKQNCPLDCR